MKSTRLLQRVRRNSYRRWRVEAEDHQRQGHYAWMARRLEGFTRVLELGVGEGRSTLELLRRGHEVLAVDENPYCLKSTATALSEAGHPPELLLRGRPETRGERYTVRYEAPTLVSSRQHPVLVEGLLGFDLELDQWLRRQAPFDAMVCWFSQLHPAFCFHVMFARPEHRATIRGGPPAIRRCLHQRAAELATRLLRPGGVLHLVERGAWSELRVDRPTVKRPPRSCLGSAGLHLEALEFEPWLPSLELPPVQFPFERGDRPEAGTRPTLRSAIWSLPR